MADVMNVHPELRRRWDLFARSLRASGFRVTVTSGYRSIAAQKRLFRARQAGKHPYPVAPPGCSEHNYGLAIDAVIEPLPTALDGLARSFGLEWAGPADDVHFGAFSLRDWSRVRAGAGIRC